MKPEVPQIVVECGKEDLYIAEFDKELVRYSKKLAERRDQQAKAFNDEQERQSREIAEQRVEQLEKTLVSRNSTTERIVEACSRIQWVWNQIKGTNC